MGAHDWYRNETWNAEIEAAFEAKLARARRKGQYLRIQASVLARSKPQVALDLLQRYFDQPDERFGDAQAHVDRATALLALGRDDEAVAAYVAALEHEKRVPTFLTGAYVEMPYEVATRGLARHYSQALAILDEHHKRRTFPLDHFMWHAAYALILLEAGDLTSAKAHASAAVRAASGEGIRGLGEVSERQQAVLDELRILASSP